MNAHKGGLYGRNETGELELIENTTVKEAELTKPRMQSNPATQDPAPAPRRRGARANNAAENEVTDNANSES